MTSTTPRSCHWCARAADDGVCRAMDDLCPAAFGMDIGQDPLKCPTHAPTPAPTPFPTPEPTPFPTPFPTVILTVCFDSFFSKL